MTSTASKNCSTPTILSTSRSLKSSTPRPKLSASAKGSATAPTSAPSPTVTRSAPSSPSTSPISKPSKTIDYDAVQSGHRIFPATRRFCRRYDFSRQRWPTEQPLWPVHRLEDMGPAYISRRGLCHDGHGKHGARPPFR